MECLASRYARELLPDSGPYEFDETCSMTFQGWSHIGSLEPSFSTITLHNKTWQLSSPPLTVDVQNSTYSLDESGDTDYKCYEDTCYGMNDLRDNSLCQPLGGYQWGFSTPLLLLLCLATTLFTSILAALHEDTLLNSRADRMHNDFNVYRDAVDLVYELVTTGIGGSVFDLEPNELRQKAEEKDRGIILESEELPYSRRKQWMLRRRSMKPIPPSDKLLMADAFDGT